MSRHLHRKSDDTRRCRGFEPVSVFVRQRYRDLTLKRGFAISRVLTAWPEIAGAHLARISTPVDVSFNSRTQRSTLVVQTSGAYAQELQMSIPLLLDRANSACGFCAVDAIRITQQRIVVAEPRSPEAAPPRRKLDPEEIIALEDEVRGIEDAGLRELLLDYGKSLAEQRPEYENSRS